MPYSRKAPKQDIRTIHLSSQTVSASSQSETAPPSNQEAETITLQHNPLRELRLILLCSIPLLVALAAGSYLDHTRHWVVPFAQWLTQRGG